MSLEDMTPEERANMKRWVDTWKLAGPELEKIREEEVRNTNTIEAFRAFKGMALYTTRIHPPEPTSGLVEQQRWFMMLARKQGLIK